MNANARQKISLGIGWRPRSIAFLNRACSLFACTLGLILACQRVSAGDLRAGFAKTDITPDEPVTLSGYDSRKEVSRGVHDPLSARAVALEKDGTHLVFVSADVL